MKQYYFSLFIILALGLAACNEEAKFLPDTSASKLTIIPNEGINVTPVSIDLLPNGNYLIVANTEESIEGDVKSKIRVIVMQKDGVILQEKLYPSNDEESWVASETFLQESGEFIIGGNTSILASSSTKSQFLFSLSATGDSLQYQTNFGAVSGEFLAGQLVDAFVYSLTQVSSNLINVSKINSNDLSLVATKEIAVEGTPSASLLVKGDTLAFATNNQINFTLFGSNEDLDEDARLSAVEDFDFTIVALTGISDASTALCFGLKDPNTSSSWFKAYASPRPQNPGVYWATYNENEEAEDEIQNVKVLDKDVFICGSRSRLREPRNFYIIRTDQYGNQLMSNVFGSENSENILYDATLDGEEIITVGKVTSNRSESIVVCRLNGKGILTR